MNFQTLNLKKTRAEKAFHVLALLGIFFMHTTFIPAGTASGPGIQNPESPGTGTGSLDTSRRKIFKRIPTLPFRDDEVHDIRLGYGMHIQFELPEAVKAAVPPDERLVSLDYFESRVYLKGIAYAVGEITNATVITESGKSLHLFIRIVEPEESDQGFKFFMPSKTVFSESHVKREVEKATAEREEDLEKRETNLQEVTEQLAEDRLKEKLLREETGLRKVRIRKNALEMKEVQVTRLGNRVYVKFSLQNRSRRDFLIGAVLLGRGITGPSDPDKVLGVEDLQTDAPTFEAGLIPAGNETKVLLSLDARHVRDTDKVVLKVIEENGAGRVVEFKNLELFAR